MAAISVPCRYQAERGKRRPRGFEPRGPLRGGPARSANEPRTPPKTTSQRSTWTRTRKGAINKSPMVVTGLGQFARGQFARGQFAHASFDHSPFPGCIFIRHSFHSIVSCFHKLFWQLLPLDFFPSNSTSFHAPSSSPFVCCTRYASRYVVKPPDGAHNYDITFFTSPRR